MKQIWTLFDGCSTFTDYRLKDDNIGRIVEMRGSVWVAVGKPRNNSRIPYMDGEVVLETVNSREEALAILEVYA